MKNITDIGFLSVVSLAGKESCVTNVFQWLVADMDLAGTMSQ